MNTREEQLLEAAIDRELKALPPHRAPATLAPRVLAALARRAPRPWYRRAWQTWPWPLQVTSLAVLCAAFTGLCLTAWQLPKLPPMASASRAIGGWLSSLEVFWSAAAALAAAAGHVLQSCSTATLVGIGAMLLLSYALCVGLTTVYVRLALARR